MRLVRQLRKELGIEHGTVQRVADQLEAANKALAQELRETRRANEILKKAAAYFAQAELDRPQK